VKTKKKMKRIPPKYYGDKILELLEKGEPLSAKQIMTKLRIRKETFKSVYRLLNTLKESPVFNVKTDKIPSKHGPRTTVYSVTK